MIHALVFLGAGTIVVLAGIALANNADVIAGATGLGRLWTGTVLLALATSLPEMMTDLSAVRMGAADLAAGDLFGSSMANMLILALVDLLPPRRQLFRKATLDHALGASLAIVLNAFAVIFVLLRSRFTVLSLSPGSMLLLVAYLAGTRAMHRQARHRRLTAGESGAAPEPGEGASPGTPRLRRALLGFAGATLAIVVAAPAFAWSAKGLAVASGLGNTFFGTVLVGLATSMPELVSSIAAVRIGALDLAVGNLFGSNALNMAIFAILDAAQPGSLFAGLDPAHALSGSFGVVLTALGLAAIVYRAEKRYAMLEPDSILMLATWVTGLLILYAHSAGHFAH